MVELGEGFSYWCLRKLMSQDCAGMLEWMHDEKIAGVFAQDFQSMSKSDAAHFIEHAYDDLTSLHFAIADIDDEYMGTVSLKNIDPRNRNAEYAISTRQRVHGTGLAKMATLDVLRYAFEVMGLHKVYLNVKETNERAIAFYRKIGFEEEGRFRQHVCEDEHYVDLLWFGMTRYQYQCISTG